MDKLKKILAPTDLSELSLAGVRYAMELANSQGGEVIVYHVIGYEEANPHDEGFYTESLGKWLIEERKRLLTEFLRKNFPHLMKKVRVHQDVEVGVPHIWIVKKAQQEGVDMIVMSTHGRTGLLHMLTGSVTEKVVRRASCPVLSVHPTKEVELPEAAIG